MGKIATFGRLDYTTSGFINQLYNKAMATLEDEYQTGYAMLEARISHAVQSTHDAMGYFSVEVNKFGAWKLLEIKALATKKNEDGSLASTGQNIADTKYADLAGNEAAEELIAQDIEGSIRSKVREILDKAVQGTYKSLAPTDGATWAEAPFVLDDWMLYAFKALQKAEFYYKARDVIGISKYAMSSIVEPAYEQYLDMLRIYLHSGQLTTYAQLAQDMQNAFANSVAMMKAEWEMLIQRQASPPVGEEIDRGRYLDIRNDVYTALQEMWDVGRSEWVRVTEAGATPEEAGEVQDLAGLPSYLRRDAMYMVDLPMTCEEIKDDLDYLYQYNAYVPVNIALASERQGEGFGGWLSNTPIVQLFENIGDVLLPFPGMNTGQRLDKGMLEAREEFERIYQALYQYQQAFCIDSRTKAPAERVYPVRSTIRDPRSTTGKEAVVYAKSALHQWVDASWAEAERGDFISEGIPTWVNLLLSSGQYADDLELLAAEKRQAIHTKLDQFAANPWDGPLIRSPDGEYLPYTGFAEGEALFRFWINREVRQAFRDLAAMSTTGANEVMRESYPSDSQVMQGLPTDALQQQYAEVMGTVFGIDAAGKGGPRTDTPGYYVPSASTLFALSDWLRVNVYDEYLAAFGDTMWKSVKDEHWDYFRTSLLLLEGRDFISSEFMYENVILPELNRIKEAALKELENLFREGTDRPDGTVGLTFFGKVIPQAGERVQGHASGATGVVVRFDHKIGSEGIGNVGGVVWVKDVRGNFSAENLLLPDRISSRGEQLVAGSVVEGMPSEIIDLENKVKTGFVAFMDPAAVKKAVQQLQEMQPMVPGDEVSRRRFEIIFRAYWDKMMTVATSTVGLDDDASAAQWATSQAAILGQRYYGLIAVAACLQATRELAAYAYGLLSAGIQGLNSYKPLRGTMTVMEISQNRQRTADAAEDRLKVWRDSTVPQMGSELNVILMALSDALSMKAPIPAASWYAASLIAQTVIPANVGDMGVSAKCAEIIRILNQNPGLGTAQTPQQANMATDAATPSASTGVLEGQELQAEVKFGGAMFSPFVKFEGMRSKYSYHVEDFEPASLEPMLAEFARPRLPSGLSAEPKLHGFRGTIQRRNKLVRIYLEGDFRDYADVYHEIAEAVAEGPDVTLEAEFMESVSGVLAARPEGKFSPGAIDKAKAVAVVFDILSLEKQHLADSPYYERRQALQRYFMEVMSDAIIPMPNIWCNTEAELITAIQTMANAAGSEGALVKTRDGIYTIKHETEDWAKVKARMRISALVLKVNKLKTGGVSYTCGVLRDNEATLRSEDAVTYRGQRYVVLGATFATPVDATVGDTIEVAVTELLRSKDDRGREVFRWEDPKVISVIDRGPDGLGRAIQVGAILQASISQPYRVIQEQRWIIIQAKSRDEVLAAKTELYRVLDETGNSRIRDFAEQALATAAIRLGQVAGKGMGDIGYGMALESGSEEMLAELEKVFSGLQDAIESQPGELVAKLKMLQAVVHSYVARIDEDERPILYANFVSLRDRVDDRLGVLEGIGAIDIETIDAALAALEREADLIRASFLTARDSGNAAAIPGLSRAATSIRERLGTLLGAVYGWIISRSFPERVLRLQQSLDEALGPDEGAEGVYLSYAALTDKLVQSDILLKSAADSMTYVRGIMDEVDVVGTAPSLGIGATETMGIGEAADYGLSFTQQPGQSTSDWLSTLTSNDRYSLSNAIYAAGNAILADVVASWRGEHRAITPEEGTEIRAVARSLALSQPASGVGKTVADVRSAWDEQQAYMQGAGLVKSSMTNLLRGNADENGLKASPVQMMDYTPWMMSLLDWATRLDEQWEAMFNLLKQAEAGLARLGGAMRLKASETVGRASVMSRFMDTLPPPRAVEAGTLMILNTYSKAFCAKPPCGVLPGADDEWEETRKLDAMLEIMESAAVQLALDEYLRGAGAAASVDGALADLKVNYALQAAVNAVDLRLEAKIKAYAAWAPDTNPYPIQSEGVPPAEAQWFEPSQSGSIRDLLVGSPYLEQIVALLEQGNRVLVGFDNEAQGQILASVNAETGDVTGDQNALVDMTWNRISTALQTEPTVQRTIDGAPADREQYLQNEQAVRDSLKGIVSVGEDCNGFYVGQGIGGNRIFVTVAHCVAGKKIGDTVELLAITGEAIRGTIAFTGEGGKGSQNAARYFPQGGIEATSDFGGGQDVAVIVVSDDTEIAKTSAMTELKIGSEYPRAAIVVAPNKGEADVIFRPGWSGVRDAEVIANRGYAEYDIYLGYDRARSGYSGAPVIDAQGRVVGFWQGRIGEVFGRQLTQRYGVIVPLDVIRAAIEAAGESVPAINLLPEAERTTLTASQTPPFTATGEMTGKLVRYKDKGWQGLEFQDLGFTIISDGAGDEGKFLEYRKDARLPAMKDFRAEGEKEELDTVRLLPSWIRNQPDDYYAEFYLSFDSHKGLNGLWAYSAEAAQDYDAPGFLFRMNDETAFWLRKDSSHKVERSKLTDAEKPSLQRIAQFLGRPPAIPAKKAS
jgi:hypothetical protein